MYLFGLALWDLGISADLNQSHGSNMLEALTFSLETSPSKGECASRWKRLVKLTAKSKEKSMERRKYKMCSQLCPFSPFLGEMQY